jgi:hypothetical protein
LVRNWFKIWRVVLNQWQMLMTAAPGHDVKATDLADDSL